MTKEERRWDMLEKGIPVNTVEGIIDWIHHGVSPGSFLQAVFCNNLLGTFIHADEANNKHVGDIVSYMYNYAPMGCWGSKENYMSWEGLDNEG